MQLTKKDIKMTKGLAIICMILLHLFCRKGGNVLYRTPFWVSADIPLIYYVGFFSEVCVPIYCFCSGYAHYIQCQKFRDTKKYFKSSLLRLFKLLINFWVVLILFSMAGLIFDKSQIIPESACKFIGNFFLYKLSYNGAWWFVLTYIFLVLLSPLLYNIVVRFNSKLVFILCTNIYIVGYCLQRIGYTGVGNLENVYSAWLTTQAMNLASTMFFYVTGMIFVKENLYGRIIKFSKIIPPKSQNSYIALVFMLIFIISNFLEKGILMPFAAYATVICFNMLNKSTRVEKLFLFLGDHSTNIWLTHMFFYSILFKDLVFKAIYPIPIFLFMLVLTLSTSYIVTFLCRPLFDIIEMVKASKNNNYLEV